MEESLHDILDTSISYERIALQKGIAGLYYRIALALVIGLFGLLIIDAVSTDAVYFDKGFTNVQFSLIQTGQVIVALAFIGDLSFQFTKFITDQQFSEFMNDKKKKMHVFKFAIIILSAGIGLILAYLLIGLITPALKEISWSLLALYFGVVFFVIAKHAHHKPTYIASVMNSLNAFLLVFSPNPVWMVFLMVLISSAFITGVVSYIQALE